MSYRTMEHVFIRLFAVALLVYAAAHTYGIMRVVNARVQSSLSAVER